MRELSTRSILGLAVACVVGVQVLVVAHAVHVLQGPALAAADRATLAVDLVVLGAGHAALTVLIAVHVRDMVFHRVEEAARMARRQAEGHREERMAVDGPREVQELSRALNQMADAMETRERRILHESGASAMSAVLLGVAHEVRNPLAAMRLSTGLLAREPDRSQVPALERIERGLDRLEDVVRTLQALAEDSPNRGADPNRVVRGALLALQGRMVRLRPPELELAATRQVAALGPQLMQALSPLMLNAIEATPDGEGFRVRTRDEGDEVVIEVHDPGPGLPPELGETIHDPFVTTKPGHAGLGLAMSRQIVVDLGGDLVAQTDGGTVVRVRLPAHPRPAASGGGAGDSLL